ncbi:MAG: ATP phosphoribosyltransferase [Candidatus Pacebacteria bacterium]|nr:ATP phosphoribosyltransferase [Candidatus Paceibacterota bacterium]
MHGGYCDEPEYSKKAQRRQELEMSNTRMLFQRALSDESLTLALPAERNLRPRTLEVLSFAGMQTDSVNERAGIRAIEDVDGFSSALFLRQPDIIRLVQSGRLPAGLVGMDALMERLACAYVNNETSPDLFLAAQLHYGNAGFGPAPRIVLFTKKNSWIDSRAKFMRRFRDRRLLVASEFPKITRGFFRSNGVDGIPVRSYGATEALVASGLYVAGVCIAETRRTLDDNGLVEIESIGRAPVVLIVNRTFLGLNGATPVIERLARRLTRAVESLTV